MKKTKYKKYQVGLTALRILITANIKEHFVSAHNNSITGFSLVDPIFFYGLHTDQLWNYPTNTTTPEWDCIGFTMVPDYSHRSTIHLHQILKTIFQIWRRAIH